jgi:hypothetical protein
MGFAYFLDPKTKAGEGFVDDDALDNSLNLNDFIILKGFCAETDTIRAECQKFIFDMQSQNDKLKLYIKGNSAMTYWYTQGKAKYPILFKVAEIVFKVPTSQAASERAWSIYDFILTKRRNRLRPAKVTQLVQLYLNGDIVNQDNLLDVLMGLQEDVGEEEEDEETYFDVTIINDLDSSSEYLKF